MNVKRADSTESVRCQSNAEAEDDDKAEPQETEKLIDVKTSTLAKAGDIETPSKPELTKEKSNTYWRYFTAGGSCLLPFTTFVAFVVAQLLCSGCDYFVAYW